MIELYCIGHIAVPPNKGMELTVKSDTPLLPAAHPRRYAAPSTAMLSLEQVIAKLHLALDDPDEIQSAARALYDFVNVEEQVFEQLDEPVKDLLAELSYDLDYFEPHLKHRREDSAFYGPARARQEIRADLEGLRREGVA